MEKDMRTSVGFSFRRFIPARNNFLPEGNSQAGFHIKVLRYAYDFSYFARVSLLELKGIGKRYIIGTEQINALHNIDLQIGKGEYVALMGPSGSGKSTLMNIIGCLDTPDSGQYLLNGKQVSGMTENELAEIRNHEIGFIFQTFNLVPRSNALDNVALPLVYAGLKKEERQQRARQALEKVGLGNRITHRPNELSGGQRQRVAVARALVNNPSIILADEPTGNLDSKTSEEIMKLFDEIHQAGNTIIVVTHEEEIAQHALRIVRIKDGMIESDQLNVKREKALTAK
jgi:putative ABC transport system ATP-binding protein